MIRLKRRKLTKDAAANERPFDNWKSFERDYERQLRKVAKEIQRILEFAATPNDLSLAEKRLEAYVELLSPWADKQAERMVSRVFEANERRWARHLRQSGFDLRGVMQRGDLAAKIAELRLEAAGYIRSLPIEASTRVGELAQQATMYGMRPAAIEQNLINLYGMTENRARLIARTEVARSNSILVQARAESLGSRAYIWQTSEDTRVRESHLEMNGKVCYWDSPPKLSDDTETHPGQIYNCRCIALPLLSDEEVKGALGSGHREHEPRVWPGVEPEPASSGSASLGGNDITTNEERVAQTLHTQELAIKDLGHEEGVIVGTNGDIIHHEKGQAHSVAPPPELIKDNIFTHNHPSGTCAFSLSDVKSIISGDGYEVRTVTSDGRFVSLARGASGWDSALGDDMAKAGLNDSGLFMKADNRAKSKYGHGRTARQRRQEIEAIMNGWLRDNAEKYGYVFTEGKI